MIKILINIAAFIVGIISMLIFIIITPLLILFIFPVIIIMAIFIEMLDIIDWSINRIIKLYATKFGGRIGK